MRSSRSADFCNFSDRPSPSEPSSSTQRAGRGWAKSSAPVWLEVPITLKPPTLNRFREDCRSSQEINSTCSTAPSAVRAAAPDWKALASVDSIAVAPKWAATRVMAPMLWGLPTRSSATTQHGAWEGWVSMNSRTVMIGFFTAIMQMPSWWSESDTRDSSSASATW